MTSKSAQTRFAAIKGVGDRISEPLRIAVAAGVPLTSVVNTEEWRAIAEAYAALAPLGRTERWLQACDWFTNELAAHDAEGHQDVLSERRNLQWICNQGSEYLCIAAE